MNTASFPGPYRRLLAVVAVSLLLHVVAFEWLLAHHSVARPETPAARIVIVARLRAAGPAAQNVQPPAPEPRSAPAGHAARAPSARAHAAAAAAPAVALAPTPESAPTARGADTNSPPEELVQMPGRYRVHTPPTVELSYDVTRSAPGQPPSAAGRASISWQASGDKYTLRIDGLPDPQSGHGGTHALASEGGIADAGIAPASVRETRSDGSSAVTRFDRQAKRIVSDDSTRSYPIGTGSQDRGSMLMQLAGMGLAEPDQIKDEIAFYVGAGSDTGIVKFAVIGQEDLAGPLGTIAAWHLAQVARPGEARFEVWLAPSRNWYPIQLRSTAPDGTASTAVATSIAQ